MITQALRACSRTRFATGPTFRSTIRLTFLAMLLAAAAPARASVDDLPELGDASSGVVSPEMERQIGEQFLKQIHTQLRTIDDPVLKYYVELQINQLTIHSELRERILSVVLIDNDEINAFAAPGGVVGINAGLFLHAQDVHEYSGVVAHELAHLSQRHFARGIEEQRAQTLPTIASLIAALMIGAMGGGDAGIAAISSVQAASQARQLRYSRKREQEADRIGLRTLAAAGMDPGGMARMFERMHRAYRFTRRPPEFLLTHPLTDSRIADARSQASAYQAYKPRQNVVRGEEDYALMQQRVRVRYAQNPSNLVKDYTQALAEQPDSAASEYGLALALSAAGEHTEALAHMEALLAGQPGKILYIASHAELLIEADRAEEAHRLLSHHLAINPDNSPLAMLHAKALTAINRNREAEGLLERQANVRPTDIDVWYALAETAGLAGNIIGVHRARAEYFALHGAYHRAIQHLEYAQRLVHTDDDRLRARIDQRIMDLRQALRAAQA